MAAVLVIDDFDQLRTAVRRMLEAMKYTVVEAGDGREGIQRFQEQPFQAVLCDLFVPNQDGLATIRTLRQTAPEVRIIAMVGSVPAGQIDFQAEAYRAGADLILPKPLGMHLLRDALRQVMTTPAAAQRGEHPPRGYH